MITLVRDNGGDWIGVYVNGVLVDEGHSLQEEQLLRVLGIPYETRSLDLDEDCSGLPHRLDELL